jgi:hypothetical protein
MAASTKIQIETVNFSKERFGYLQFADLTEGYNPIGIDELMPEDQEMFNYVFQTIYGADHEINLSNLLTVLVKNGNFESVFGFSVLKNKENQPILQFGDYATGQTDVELSLENGKLMWGKVPLELGYYTKTIEDEDGNPSDIQIPVFQLLTWKYNIKIGIRTSDGTDYAAIAMALRENDLDELLACLAIAGEGNFALKPYTLVYPFVHAKTVVPMLVFKITNYELKTIKSEKVKPFQVITVTLDPDSVASQVIPMSVADDGVTVTEHPDSNMFDFSPTHNLGTGIMNKAFEAGKIRPALERGELYLVVNGANDTNAKWVPNHRLSFSDPRLAKKTNTPASLPPGPETRTSKASSQSAPFTRIRKVEKEAVPVAATLLADDLEDGEDF